MTHDDDRTLAIMTKAPRAGHVKTRLASAYAADEVLILYRALVEDTIDLARTLRVPIVAMCPAADAEDLRRWLPGDVDVVAQRGSGLADGLLSTFEMLCGETGRRVIAFNADSPHLPVDVLESAFATLASADLVIGPCDDGGYYLVGATRSYPGLFDPTSMGKESACGALVAQAERRKLRIAMIAEHYDVDLPEDVVRLARELANEPQRAMRTTAVLHGWREAGREPQQR